MTETKSAPIPKEEEVPPEPSKHSVFSPEQEKQMKSVLKLTSSDSMAADKAFRAIEAILDPGNAQMPEVKDEVIVKVEVYKVSDMPVNLSPDEEKKWLKEKLGKPIEKPELATTDIHKGKK